MGDKFKHVNSGDPVKGFPAEAMNFMLEGAKLGKQYRSGQTARTIPSTDHGLIFIKNTTGSALNEFDIIGIDDEVVFDESDNETEYKLYPTFVGSIPSEADHTAKFAVVVEPIANNKRGQAVAVGVVACTVDITDEAHTFADVADGQTGYLASGDSGYARILRKPAGTGQKLCIVRLAGGGGGCTCLEVHEIKVQGIATSGSFVLAVSVDPDGSGPDASQNITIQWDDTAAEVKTAYVGHTQIATGDISTTGGPLPNVSVYVVFSSSGTLNRTQPLPGITNSLSGTSPIPKVGKMTSHDWEA